MKKYTYRVDLKKHLLAGWQSRVERCYEQGFDAIIEGQVCYFTYVEDSLNPLSFLVPQEAVAAAFEGQEIKHKDGLMALGSLQLKEAQPIEVASYPSLNKINQELLHKNLQVLGKGLKLFGKKSIIWQLLFTDLAIGHEFYGKGKFFLGEGLGLEAAEHLGVGEGLTPSFDDYLSGFLMVDRGLGFNAIGLAGDFWAAAKDKTSVQSVQQLEFANLGRSALRFEKFLLRLLDSKLAYGEVLPLINWGHSSGTDILCGILAGLGYNFYGYLVY